MIESTESVFDPTILPAVLSSGHKKVRFKAGEHFFLQGDVAKSVFYLENGRARLTVVSSRGKEATIALCMPGDFMGEDSLANELHARTATGTAITACVAIQLDREAMIRLMHEENSFRDHFMGFLLSRSLRTQADLVDHLFNSCEQRLARILLIMADFGQPGEIQPLLPEISQQMLAEMVGTTRSRISFFMNRFRKLGFIEYGRRIRVDRSLLNIVLRG